jgi:hypothetical protein
MRRKDRPGSPSRLKFSGARGSSLIAIEVERVGRPLGEVATPTRRLSPRYVVAGFGSARTAYNTLQNVVLSAGRHLGVNAGRHALACVSYSPQSDSAVDSRHPRQEGREG